MLFPAKMKKVSIVCQKERAPALVNALHSLKTVEIRESSLESKSRPLSGFDDLSSLLVKLRGLKKALDLPSSDALSAEEALKAARSINFERAFALLEERKRLEEQIAKLKERVAVLEGIGEDVDLANLPAGLKYKVGYLEGVVGEREGSEEARGEVLIGGKEVKIIIYKDEKALSSFLSSRRFKELSFPLSNPAQDLKEARAQLLSLQKRLEEVEGEIAGLKRSLHNLDGVIKALEQEAKKMSIAVKFGETAHFYFIEGWVPAKNLARVKEVCERAGAYLEVEEKPKDDPPILLENKGNSKYFQFITESYTMPSYHDLDPTFFYYIGLPILFALIVGDFVYGVISLLIGSALMKKFKKGVMHNVGKIWFLSAFPTMLVGIAFDEFAGMTHLHLLEILEKWGLLEAPKKPLYYGFHRVDEVMLLLAGTALVGAIHLAVGFILGAYSAWRHGHIKHALAKIAWLGIDFGLVIAVAGAAMNINDLFLAGLGVIVPSVIVLGATEKLVGIIEIPGLIGNILSYTRIAAVGIVGVVLAELINEFFTPLPEKGILAIIFLPLFFILHSINAFIAMFEALIQGGRLNLIEFSSKFLHGGGRKFKPFGGE